MVEIAPSILSADFTRLGEQLAIVEKAGASYIHVDVMDGHFVPNLTIGPFVVGWVRKATGLPIDAHLMIEKPDQMIPAFAKAGANMISIHPEATYHLQRSLALIRSSGCKAGLVLNPASPLSWLDHVLDKVDLVLLMSVNPGFAGQSFIASTLEKIAAARRLIDASGRDIRLEVDGGIKVDNIGRIAKAGADTFVAGSAIFASADYRATIDAMRREIAGAAK